MILIIGGMGFIGLNTALRFLEVGQKIVLTQHSRHQVPEALKGAIGTRVFVARMDVTNPYEVFEIVRRHQIAESGDQLLTVLNRVRAGIVASDQERGGAELVVFEHRLRDRFGGADERRRIP